MKRGALLWRGGLLWLILQGVIDELSPYEKILDPHVPE